jgi:hypothetical protein
MILLLYILIYLVLVCRAIEQVSDPVVVHLHHGHLNAGLHLSKQASSHISRCSRLQNNE